ncbi:MULTISPECIES: hypothetical protein [Chryseobacterium]|uniref:Uncharacterized protein n=1 Tax=Chryseobacterium taihuense TaxID=1141221 RepID=A0A4U8WFH5_9FLAO|nr:MULTISPECIES: hypothetical protein [Chryseobacterium]QQV02280.1 hypothetical protein I6I61_14595 [Chryseobacterium sp. FDAARGOS 1104]VFB04476.1 Uncharacterised protein [Chryseobacterium taihuense]
MMKKISFLMLFALSFLVLSCRTEEFHNEEVSQTISQPRLTTKRISLNESKHRTKLLPDLEKAETAIEKKKLNVQGKSVNIGNGITIDTDEVIFMENGPDFHTYTFSVIRDNASGNAPVENILMTPNTDGSYRVFHIVLNLTEADKAKIANKEYVDYKNKQQVTELTGINLSSLTQKQICVPHYFSYPVSCKEGLHEPGQPCAYAGTSGAAYWGSIVLYDCFGELPATIMPTPMPIDGGGGGGGGECPDCPDNTKPVQCVQIATNPTQVGILDPNGCIVGVPTEPYVVKSFNLIVRALPADVKALLTSNTQFYNGLQTYYNANPTQQGENFVQWAAQFSWENPNVTWAEFQPMLTFAHNFLQENPDTLNPEALFQRLKDLDDALVQNPNLLIDIPCSQLDDWQAVAMHQVPPSVKSKLQNIKNQTGWWNNWETTNLDQGASTGINMDLFPIKINSLPNKPNTNIKYTPSEFFDFFRKNINLFADKFTPIEDSYYNIHDTALWNSANPLGALLHIDINPDDGTVVCSGFNSNTWIFTTIKAPFGYAYDGIHPVTGNRVFSYHIDNNGQMTIYTRGVDRMSKKAPFNTPISAIANYAAESAAFAGADALWNNMQKKLSKHINDNGGNASVVEAKKYRPNYSKVKDYLKNKATIQSLGCN